MNDQHPTTAVFFAMLRRDIRVARRELPFFLLRTALQPLMLMVVFGYLLPKMGMMQAGYTSTLLPGVLALSLALSAVQSVALPMVAQFGFSKEIEDRLLAPVPTRIVALELVVAGTLQGLLAGLFVLPAGRLIMGPIQGLALGNFPEIFLVMVLGAATFSALGLLIGCAISPQQIGLMFSSIIGPMIFFGCMYYPWRALDKIPFMKYAVLVNPLVYVAEGMRATLIPSIPHMDLTVVCGALVFLLALFWFFGQRGFMKRAIT
ncbi:MAG: ABC transporter permease [bacterium]|jgi:ABC-2 type transport system permease protein|nr:ABC transporter permease [bacterium]